uniref:Uncharacterized protein n=1 Tax=Anguilla anguilla TaxID=7936 RepID=A0A0E9U1Q8_ANGAN
MCQLSPIERWLTIMKLLSPFQYQHFESFYICLQHPCF